MKIKFPRILLFLHASVTLLFFVSCGPAVPPEIQTSESVTPHEILSTLILETATASPVSITSPACLPEDWPCPADSLTLTAITGSTLTAIPTNTPPPWATILPAAGDLGWGSIYGNIVDGVTMFPIKGAAVKCEQLSDTSPYLCNGVATTDGDGNYAFPNVFFHDTDRITLIVEATGYTSLRFEQVLFTQPELQANLGLFPESGVTLTPTPFVMMCTYPACDGILVCRDPNGCKGGCGAICQPMTPTP